MLHRSGHGLHRWGRHTGGEDLRLGGRQRPLTQTLKVDGHRLEGWSMEVTEGSTEAGEQEAFRVESCLKFGEWEFQVLIQKP